MLAARAIRQNLLTRPATGLEFSGVQRLTANVKICGRRPKNAEFHVPVGNSSEIDFVELGRARADCILIAVSEGANYGLAKKRGFAKMYPRMYQ